jgi:hypothetical protein
MSGFLLAINNSMANKFTSFLNNLPTGPKGNMGDFQHASKIFVKNINRLHPRTKFLGYVHFHIDTAVLRNPNFQVPQVSQELGVLVKTADLPKANFESQVKNQYNRRRIVYKQINYEPINITFHDDTQGLMQQLYQKYYQHYAVDGLRNFNHDFPMSNVPSEKQFGMDRLDPGKDFPFFRRITLYTFSQGRFNGYTLFAPRIKSWSHGNIDYAANDLIESTMNIEYEGFEYLAGKVSFNEPDGWASLYYDQVASPNSIAGGGIRGIFQPIADIANVFDKVTVDGFLRNPQQYTGPVLESLGKYGVDFNPTPTPSNTNASAGSNSFGVSIPTAASGDEIRTKAKNLFT